MPTYSISCPAVCPIDNPYEVSANCDTTKAGVEPNVLIIGYCQLESVLTSTGDATITDIIAAAGQTAVKAQFKESETAAIISAMLNDNDNAVETDEITGKGTAVDSAAFEFFRQFKGKHVVVILERSDAVWMGFGWDGGLKLREWKYETGLKQNEDFHGFSFKFENKTRKTGRIIIPDPTDYPGGMDDLIAALT